MATIVTELNIVPARQEADWVENITATDASGGVDIKAAVADYRYGIKNFTAVSNDADGWLKMLDGTSTMVGPIILAKGVPITLDFESPVYNTRGSALVLKTSAAFGVFLLITGTTGPPLPSVSPSPSASPSA